MPCFPSAWWSWTDWFLAVGRSSGAYMSGARKSYSLKTEKVIATAGVLHQIPAHETSFRMLWVFCWIKLNWVDHPLKPLKPLTFVLAIKENLTVKSLPPFFNRGNLLFWEILVICIGKKNKSKLCKTSQRNTNPSFLTHHVLGGCNIFYTKPIRKMLRVFLKIALSHYFFHVPYFLRAKHFSPSGKLSQSGRE